MATCLSDKVTKECLNSELLANNHVNNQKFAIFEVSSETQNDLNLFIRYIRVAKLFSSRKYNSLC